MVVQDRHRLFVREKDRQTQVMAGESDDANPWDRAHAAARTERYTRAIEPDVVVRSKSAPFRSFFNMFFPPFGSVSAGWHLETDFTGFAEVRGLTTGEGVRIGHLDTGYTPGHPSTPPHLLADLGWDFCQGCAGAIDPGTTGGLLDFPGHGTATLALLAGGRMSLPVSRIAFDAEIGGAPGAEVVPVRISPRIVDFGTAALAQGIDYAVAKGCDVISISHGGTPSLAWAQAVNAAYEAGVIVVAASGDNFKIGPFDFPTHNTTYPGAFNRVITVLGATFAHAPYVTRVCFATQGNWGPPAVMQKAIAAYTPNVAWMNAHGDPLFTMKGAGTSASTPQVAAACALWLSLYGKRMPRDWRRVEACRVALFGSARNNRKNVAQLGWGLLDVPALLEPNRADDVIQRAMDGELSKSAEDQVSLGFWRPGLGLPPVNSQEECMYEAEVAQVVHHSTNRRLRRAAEAAERGEMPSATEASRLREVLAAQPISRALRVRIMAQG